MSDTMSFDIDDVAVSHKMRTDAVRRVLVTPAEASADDREKGAEVLIRMLLGRTVSDGRFPNASVISSHKSWRYLRSKAKENDVMFSLVFEELFPVVVSSVADADARIFSAEERIEEYSELMDLLESIYPGRNFEDSSYAVYSALSASRERIERVMRRKEVLRWIAEIIRHFESETIDSDKISSTSQRDAVVLADASESMFGEPEIITKAMILSISKRLMSDNRNVYIKIMSQDGLVSIDLSAGKDNAEDFVNLITYSFGTGTGFDEMFGPALVSMKQGLWNGCDLIMISNGIGVRNSIRLAREWETYRKFGDIRTFSLSAGTDGVKGLTELSDNIYVMNDTTITGKRGEYSRLISDLG